MSLMKDYEERARIYKKFKRKAALDFLAEMQANVEERDKWLLGLDLVPEPLKEAYNEFMNLRDSYPENSKEWELANLYVLEQRRYLDCYYNLAIKLYKQELAEELAMEQDEFGGIIGMSEDELFAKGKKGKSFKVEEEGERD